MRFQAGLQTICRLKRCRLSDLSAQKLQIYFPLRVETQDHFRLGDVPITDTHEAAARSEAIAAQVLALETDLRLKEEAFVDATGLQSAGLTLMIPDAVDVPAPLAPLADWLQDAQARSPQLRMQRAAVEVARQEAAKSRGVLSPSVDLVAQLGRERLSGSGDYGNATNSSGNRMIGVQVSIPLYTGGMRGARALEALHGIEKAQAQADRARQQVAQQARSAWLGLTVGAGRITALTQALVSTRSRLDSTRLGHQVGDLVLQDFAQRVMGLLRRPAQLARYGGDEFMVLLPRTSADEAAQIAERIRTSRPRRSDLPDGHVSIGMAFNLPTQRQSLDDLISQADQGLYLAKQGGRDRIEMAPAASPHPGMAAMPWEAA